MSRPLKEASRRQKQVLQCIINHIHATGFPPTIREIGDALDPPIKSTNGVNDHLKALEKKGYLLREDAKSRALRPLFTPEGDPFDLVASDEPDFIDEIHKIPVLGRIAAGEPIAAIENAEDHVAIGEGLLGRQNDVFGLVVRGESMIEDGIHDGDYIFVKRQQDARRGEIVAAMVEGEATVKRFYREGDRIRLQPANSSMEPIYIHAQEGRDTQILGKVIGVFRRLH